MNIFYSSPCPIKCAEFLDDKRVIKMAVETAQLLSNALDGPYKKTHYNHPCSIWVRESQENAAWLIQHLQALCTEYTKAYNKRHRCEDLVDLFTNNLYLLPSSGRRSDPPNCTFFKSMPVCLAYRQYICLKWAMFDKRKPTKYKKPILIRKERDAKVCVY